ncbi:hypothetical protein ACB092_07G136500 [Castanea dentata]
MSYNLIKQLSNKNENWKVRVRLSRILDMVLIDEQDDTIHATIQKNNVKKFQTQLREGRLYSLSNFQEDTYKGKDSYWPLSKEKKINFLRTTVIEELKESEVTISQHKFEFVDYQTIVDRFGNNKHLTDSLKNIIGKIVGVGPLENVHVPMRNIDIMNPEEIKIRITLWGPTSNQIEDNFYNNNPGPFVIIVTSTIVKTFRGEHYLSSTSATKVYINLEIPKTATLIDRNVEKTEIEGIPLQFKQEISENVFTCLATIENIEKNFGWYYIGCAKCNKKVKSENDFWCNNCKSNSNFPIPRYRIQLNVDDGTERAIFILFDKEAEKLLHTTARELSNKYATMNAYSTLPNKIEKLIGKTFVFQLKLNDYNWKEGWELYTIEKVFDNISNDETAMKLDHITKVRCQLLQT